MKIILSLVFFAVLIWASYKAGNKGAGYGIALFIVGTLGFSMFANGPASLWRGDSCTRYSSIADDC